MINILKLKIMSTAPLFGGGYKKIPCSTQLNMKIFLLINVKMPAVVGILTFMSRENSILGLSEPEKKLYYLIYSYL